MAFKSQSRKAEEALQSPDAILNEDVMFLGQEASTTASPLVSDPEEFQVGDRQTSAPEEATGRESVDLEIQRVKADIEAEEATLSSDKWRDVSKPTAKVFFKYKQNPARDCLRIAVDTPDQVPAVPMLETKDGKILCGAIPTALALPHWPQWFPFCESNTLLKRFSPSCFITHCKLKVLFLHVDFVMLLDFEDNLQTDKECLEIWVTSPPSGSEGSEWLGVHVPPKCGSLPRPSVRHGVFRLRPLSRKDFHVDWHLELDDVSGAPQWIKVFAIQQLAVRILPELVKLQAKIPGSAMDRYLNGQGEDCLDEENLNFIYDVHRSLMQHADRVEARGGQR